MTVRTLSLAALLLLLSTSACDTTVDPFLETDRYFTLFGTLDMARDTQYVRVVPVRRTLEGTSAEPLSVSFTSTDLETGDERLWQDSVVTFFNGRVGHIFYAPMRVQSGHTYQIEVASGDSVSTATTTVPLRPAPEIQEPALQGGLPGGRNTRATGLQSVHWDDLPREPFEVDVWYRFLAVGDGSASPSGPEFRDIEMPDDPDREAISGGWKVTIDLDDNRNALDTLSHPDAFPLMGVGMRVTILDAEFVPPGGEFDPDALAEPGTFSNVNNGFGFVGSVGRFSAEWTFSEETIDRLHYVSLEDIYGSARAAQLTEQYHLDEAVPPLTTRHDR